MNVLLKLVVKGNNNVDGYNTKFFRMLCIRHKITTNKRYKGLKRRDWFLCGTKTWASRETKIITNSKCTVNVNTVMKSELSRGNVYLAPPIFLLRKASNKLSFIRHPFHSWDRGVAKAWARRQAASRSRTSAQLGTAEPWQHRSPTPRSPARCGVGRAARQPGGRPRQAESRGEAPGHWRLVNTVT